METWVVREVCANSEGDCRNETTCGRWKINWFTTHLMVSFQYLGFIQLIGYILAHTQSHIHILHWLLGLAVQLWKKKCGISLRSVKVVFVHVDIEIHWIQVSGSSYDKVLRCSDTDLGGWTDVRSIRVCDDRERMVWVFFSHFPYHFCHAVWFDIHSFHCQNWKVLLNLSQQRAINGALCV